jgi:hypothetical protein
MANNGAPLWGECEKEGACRCAGAVLRTGRHFGNPSVQVSGNVFYKNYAAPFFPASLRTECIRAYRRIDFGGRRHNHASEK